MKDVWGGVGWGGVRGTGPRSNLGWLSQSDSGALHIHDALVILALLACPLDAGL